MPMPAFAFAIAIFSLSDNVRGSRSACERSAESSSEMVYPIVDDLSVNGTRGTACELEDPFEEKEWTERMEDVVDPLRPFAPPLTGGDMMQPPLGIPASVEVRGDADDKEVRVLEESADELDERVLCDIIRMDSWSDIREGPGTGGRGAVGGREGGGLRYCCALGSAFELGVVALGVGALRTEAGVPGPVKGGMKEGGVGNASRMGTG